jgi:sugar lactone lactonase YvrE
VLRFPVPAVLALSILVAACGSNTAGPSTPASPPPTGPRIAAVRSIIRGLGLLPPQTAERRGRVHDPLFRRYGFHTRLQQRASIAFHDGTVLYVNQGTEAVLTDPHVTVVRKGEVNLADEPGSRHVVRTANAIATAIGTNFDIRAAGSNSTITVVSGAVKVASHGGDVTVHANQQTTVTGHAAPTPPKAVDAAAVIGWTALVAAQGWEVLKASSALHTATGLGVDRSRNVYVASSGNGTILKISPVGQVLSSFGTIGKKPGQFQEPADVAVAHSGDIYVTDAIATFLDRFSPSGTFISRVGKYQSEGTAPGQFWGPAGVTFDAQGRIYTVEHGNSRVQRFSSTLKPEKVFDSSSVTGGLSGPEGVAINNAGDIYISDLGNNRVVELSPSGAVLRTWGTKGSAPGQFSQPLGIAIDGTGNVYVADELNNRVQEFTSTGEFLTAWGTPAQADEPFSEPQDVAVAQDGTIYVLELNRLLMLPAD